MGKLRKEKILEFIKDYIEKKGYSPAYSEIGIGVGLRSRSTVFNYIQELIKEGKLENENGKPRTLKILTSEV